MQRVLKLLAAASLMLFLVQRDPASGRGAQRATAVPSQLIAVRDGVLWYKTDGGMLCGVNIAEKSIDKKLKLFPGLPDFYLSGDIALFKDHVEITRKNYLQAGNSLAAVDLKHGKKLWELKAPGIVYNLVISKHLVLYAAHKMPFYEGYNRATPPGHYEVTLYAADLQSGKIRWSVNLWRCPYPCLNPYASGSLGAVDTIPLILGRNFFIACHDRQDLCSRETETGKLNWSVKIGHHVSSPFMYADGKLFLSGAKLAALNLVTRRIAWSFDPWAYIKEKAPFADMDLYSGIKRLFRVDGIIAFVIDYEGSTGARSSSVWGVDMKTGKLHYGAGGGYDNESTYIADGVSYYEDPDVAEDSKWTVVEADDLKSGKTIWSHTVPVNSRILGITNHLLLFIEGSNALLARAAKTYRGKWKIHLPGGSGEIQDYLASNNLLYVLKGGKIYGINFSSGMTEWIFSP